MSGCRKSRDVDIQYLIKYNFFTAHAINDFYIALIISIDFQVNIYIYIYLKSKQVISNDILTKFVGHLATSL
jgi:hypothetical protein